MELILKMHVSVPGCRLLSSFLLAAFLATMISARAQDVTTWHYDNARSGVQPNETALTPGNVNSSTFGKVFGFPVVGDVYAQPLYLSQYQMADGQLHNVLIVATAEDYVYAFDADGNNPAQGYLWMQSVAPAGETFVSYTDVGGVTDIKPNIGVIGTPVIDRTAGAIYLVAKSKTTGSTPVFHQRLHALNISDGTEILNGPTEIAATVAGSGDGGITVSFNTLLNNQRSALLLAPTPAGVSGNSIFITWASHGDKGAYHGWVIAYNSSDISQQTGAWSVTPNGTRGGIWMCAGGPASDNEGDVFLATANGSFDANTGGSDYGDSALRFTLGSGGLNVADSFTPGDQATLSSSDRDMGTGGVVLLPAQSGSIANLAVTADKSGTIYLVDTDKMGGYLTPQDSSWQNFSAGFTIHTSFAFFNNTLYGAPDRAPMSAWAFDPSSELLSTTPVSTSSHEFGCSACVPTGSTPVISANGTSNPILWAIDNSYYYNDPAVLYAFDATNLTNEIYDSSQAPNSRDAAAVAIKFTVPTVASGRVYVGGRNAIDVYGLLTVTPPITATPQISPAGGSYTGAQTVKITDGTTGAAIYYTTDGTTPSNQSPSYSASFTVTSSEVIQAIAIAPGDSQSAVAKAAFTITAPPPMQVQVSLASVANLTGIYTDGTKFTTGGFNTTGSAYSASLVGKSITYSGVTYAIGAANEKDMVRGSSPPVIKLTAGKYATLKLLGAAISANQKTAQGFTVTYTDGTTSKFSQSISNWLTPQHYKGESIALSTPYCDTSKGGRTTSAHDLYQYSFALNSAKTVKSLTIPSNKDVIVAAVTLDAGD
jgi:hypothetical protein